MYFALYPHEHSNFSKIKPFKKEYLMHKFDRRVVLFSLLTIPFIRYAKSGNETPLATDNHEQE
jgi:hypothetical protein